ncbi:MAG: T9SS type A sorting domain-containing protein [Candidatus Marinimicrobia bacterium]|nr:T9SS type A sorting domain-containing protein [Candidatus Neomarinimicrobiota bacterium]
MRIQFSKLLVLTIALLVALGTGNSIYAQGHGGGHHGGGHGNHGIDTVTVSGTAVVLTDTGRCFARTAYFIDVDNNDSIDFALRFGPEDYEPDNGAVRPVDGEQITVTGGLRSRRGRPSIIVWELNGLEWMNPDSLPGGGHGGGHHGGGGHGGFGGDLDSVLVTGILMAELDTIRDHERTRYFLDQDQDSEKDYFLKLRYYLHSDPNAVIPEVGTAVEITGGLLDCDFGLDGIVVFVLNPTDPNAFGIMSIDSKLADEYQLSSTNYPNPFNPVTTIKYFLPEAGNVSIAVFNITGHKVKTLVKEYQTGGSHSVVWNATDDLGRQLTSGIYLYRIDSGKLSETRRMILLK